MQMKSVKDSQEQHAYQLAWEAEEEVLSCVGLELPGYCLRLIELGSQRRLKCD